MISKDMIKHIVLNKTAQCLKKMPSDVYALYYFIDAFLIFACYLP